MTLCSQAAARQRVRQRITPQPPVVLIEALVAWYLAAFIKRLDFLAAEACLGFLM